MQWKHKAMMQGEGTSKRYRQIQANMEGTTKQLRASLVRKLRVAGSDEADTLVSRHRLKRTVEYSVLGTYTSQSF